MSRNTNRLPERACVATLLILTVALVLCGCGAASNASVKTKPPWPHPPVCCVIPLGPSLGEAIDEAKRIFVGRIARTPRKDEDHVSIEVLETLKGEAKSPIVVVLDPALLPAPRNAEGNEGVFITDGATPARVLFKGDPLDVSRREVVRILAGLSPYESEPGDEQFAELSRRSDLVVFATSTAVTAPKSTVDPNISRVKVDVIEVLKGTPEGDVLDVVRGPLPKTPGGPWSFDEGMPGVFFLQRQGDHYVTISPMPPQVIFPPA